MAMVLLSLALLTISFEAVDGASIDGEEPATYHTVTFYSGDQVLKTESVLSGSKVTTPTIDYPVLANWCIGSIDGDVFDPESHVTSDLDLYAKYVDCSIGEPTLVASSSKTLTVSFQLNNAESYVISWGDGINSSSSVTGNAQYYSIHTYSSTIPTYITINASNPSSSDEISVKISFIVTLHDIDETISSSTVLYGRTISAPSSIYLVEWHIGDLNGELFNTETPIVEDLELFGKCVSPVIHCSISQEGTISKTVRCEIGIYYATSFSVDWGDGTSPETLEINYLDGIYGDIHGFNHTYESGGHYQITVVGYAPLNSTTESTTIELQSTPEKWLQSDGSYLFDQNVTGSIVLDGDTIIDMGGYLLYASVDVGDSTLVLKNAYTFRSITGKHVIVEGVSDASFDLIECEVLDIYGKGISTINFHHPAGDGRNVTIFPGSLGAVSIFDSKTTDFITNLAEGSSITIVNDLITIHGEASMDSPLDDRTIQVDGKLSFSDRNDIQTGVVMMNGSKITLKDVRPGYVGMELKAGSVHMTGTFTSEDGGSIILDGQSYVDGSVVLDGVTAIIMSGSTFTVSKDSTIEGINGGGIDNNGTVLVYGSLKASVDNSDGVTNFYEGSIGSNKVVGGTVNGVDTPMPVPDEDDPKKDNENKSDGIDTKTIVISLVVVGIIGILIGRRFL